MSDMLQKNREIRDKMLKINEFLQIKADALAIIGLSYLSRFLSETVMTLNDIQKDIEKMVDDEFTSSLRRAEMASTNTLKSSLAALDFAGKQGKFGDIKENSPE